MGKNIQLKASDGHQFDAYVAEPAGKPRGLVIVAPEIFGVNSHIRSVADGFAADGYLTIAPAFFDRAQTKYESGYTQPEIGAGVEIMKKVSFDHTMLDVKAAIEHGKHAGKVGIVGYCWGGVIAWLAAGRVDGLACSVPYYGGAIPSFLKETPKCPVMFSLARPIIRSRLSRLKLLQRPTLKKPVTSIQRVMVLTAINAVHTTQRLPSWHASVRLKCLESRLAKLS